MDKNKKLFPQRLWDLVNSNECSRYLRWSDEGRRVYLNRAEFEEHYLRTPQNQFHTQKAISFVRQMNMYGFKKVDDFHYENDNFRRGCHHLIKNMIRRNSNKSPGSSAFSNMDNPTSRNDAGEFADDELLADTNDISQPTSHLARSSDLIQMRPVASAAHALIGPSPSYDFDRLASRSHIGRNGRSGPYNRIELASQRVASKDHNDTRALMSLNDVATMQKVLSMFPRTNDLEARLAAQHLREPGVISHSNGSGIAQSSLASTIFQRLAQFSEQPKKNILHEQQTPLSQTLQQAKHHEQGHTAERALPHQGHGFLSQLGLSQHLACEDRVDKRSTQIGVLPAALATALNPMLLTAASNPSLGTRLLEQQQQPNSQQQQQRQREHGFISDDDILQQQQLAPLQQTRQLQNQQLSTCDLYRELTLASPMQSLVAQQMLQHTLVGSLMQLSVARDSHSLNNYILDSLQDQAHSMNNSIGGVATSGESFRGFNCNQLTPTELPAASPSSPSNPSRFVGSQHRDATVPPNDTTGMIYNGAITDAARDSRGSPAHSNGNSPPLVTRNARLGFLRMNAGATSSSAAISARLTEDINAMALDLAGERKSFSCRRS